jgi:hypothetical protein
MHIPWFLFLRTISFTWSTFNLFYLPVGVQSIQNLNRRQDTFEMWKQLKNLCSPPCLLSRSYLQQSEDFHSTFSHYNTKYDAETVFFRDCHFCCMLKLQMDQHIRTERDITQHPHMLRPYDSMDTTQETLLYAHLLAQVCARRTSAISRSVQKLFHNIKYTTTNKPTVPTYK